MILLEEYNKAKEELFKAFDCVYARDSYGLVDYTEVYWGWSDDYLNYIDDVDDSEGESYGLIVNPKSIHFYGDYTMLVVDDDNGGDPFLAVFDNNKRDLDEL